MHSLKSKSVLIFGGSGFLGTHLTKRLLELSARPTVTDLRPPSFSVPFHQLNITDKPAVSKLISRGWGVIINLAGLSGTVASQQQVQASFETNVIGSLNILEPVRHLKTKPVILFSNSRQEYGQPQYLPVDELHPTNPTNLYGIHKLAITHLAQLYAHTYNLPTIVIRTSNVYGPSSTRQSNYNIVNYWLNQAANGQSITLFGQGAQKRDYLFISDWVEAVIKAIATPKAYGEIINLGLGQGITLYQMAKLISRQTGVKIINKPWPQDWQKVETGDYITNITKAHKLLGWRPKTDFDTGIKRTFQTLKI